MGRALRLFCWWTDIVSSFLQLSGHFGKLRLKALDFKVQLHAAVELALLGRTGTEAGNATGQAFMLSQCGAAAFGGGGVCRRREATRQPGGGVGFKALHPAMIERLEMLARLAGEGEGVKKRQKRGRGDWGKRGWRGVGSLLFSSSHFLRFV